MSDAPKAEPDDNMLAIHEAGHLVPVLKMERGCVEDQPQHMKRFQTLEVLWVAAAGRGRHSRKTDAMSCILDTLAIVRRKDEEQWGDYRTQSVILEICDAPAAATQSCQPYQARLNPPSADPC
ncbi:MAG: hypothetical protein O2960_06170 [Verrucomicrobia bacterium]|nr:hypothetical protein [Verrucomicrobiota bacterium]